MVVYRVLPHREDAGTGEPGHALYVHPDQGLGRWDNPDLYRMLYVATSAAGAIGEAFAHLSRWSAAMLPFPAVVGAHRRLAVYRFDETSQPPLDLDDSKALLDRGLRPTDIVKRNRPRTQQIARDVFGEGRWSGVSWWSMHRPEWILHALWNHGGLAVDDIQDLPGHPALHEAGTLLAKEVDRRLV